MPPTCSVQDLALELLQEIILLTCQEWDDSLSKKELSLLRLVSWQFRDAVDPFLFAELKFDFVKRPFEIVIQQLRDMAEGKTEICHHVKKLIIESTEVQLSGSVTQGTYVNLLMRALKSLLELRSFRWNFCRMEGFYSIMDGITNLAHLTDVYIDFSKLPVLWQIPELIMLDRFTELQSLGFRALTPSVPLANSFIQQLRIISTKQSLTSLDIEFTSIPGKKDIFHDIVISIPGNKEIFHDIVKDLPRQTPLKIKHLRVHGWKLVLNPIIVPHLRYLTSLDLSYADDTLTDQRLHASVWSSLIHTTIELKRIVSIICRALNLYLRSYTGLEHLTITLPREENMRVDSVTSDPLFGDLCQNSLPAHTSTMKNFKVLDKSSRGHCVLSDIIAIGNCDKLECLAITVEVDHIDNFGDIVSTALGMPCLRVLDIGGYGPIPRHIPRQRFNTLNTTDIEPMILDVLKNIGERSGSAPVIIFGEKRYNIRQEPRENRQENG